MLEKIDIKEVDMEKYKTEYVRAIWVTPIQIDSFDNVYIAERNGKPIMLVNVLLNERIATLFLSVQHACSKKLDPTPAKNAAMNPVNCRKRKYLRSHVEEGVHDAARKRFILRSIGTST